MSFQWREGAMFTNNNTKQKEIAFLKAGIIITSGDPD